MMLFCGWKIDGEVNCGDHRSEGLGNTAAIFCLNTDSEIKMASCKKGKSIKA